MTDAPHHASRTTTALVPRRAVEPFPVAQRRQAVWVLSGTLDTTPGAARRHVGHKLTEWGVAPDTVDDAQLVTSELSTNAVQHTTSGHIQVELVLTDGEIEVTVTDCGPPRALTLHSDGTFDEHGRGLALVEALTTRWGYRRYGEGTEVWAVLQTPHARQT